MAARLAPGLERRLKAEVTGDVWFDRFNRGRYATDASFYQIMPVGVVVPRTTEEAERAIALARAEGIPVTPRAGAPRNAARPSTNRWSSTAPSTSTASSSSTSRVGAASSSRASCSMTSTGR